MTTQSAYKGLIAGLTQLYDAREAANIADWVMESVTGKKRIDRLLDQHREMAEVQQNRLAAITQQLLNHTPVQYVLGEAWFAGMRFYVNEHTLIPRPETEELVAWIEDIYRKEPLHYRCLLDIGTGSGCIPIVLKKNLPDLSVTSVDISTDAIVVADRNAEELKAIIEIKALDFLAEVNWSELPVVDMIVSNPPYIKQSEQQNMAKHVVDYEPRLALFVPDEDALLFYRKISVFAKSHLLPKGSIFLEINEALGNEVAALFEQSGYAVELRKDLQGKDRMIRAHFPH
ncbi:MAG: prmC [Sediminibacterium sp.]|nr:prmC [Sediminibacterium sp.]